MKIQLTLEVYDTSKPDEIAFALMESARQFARFPNDIASLDPNVRIHLKPSVACMKSAMLQRLID